ncbi:hypothetical protein [Sphingomonas sp. 3-13AW]|uniref:hypothetical protein n=1 Tax=Sphingomonas sp. 3-13AW TaxID=3050450 RepID=UPI003BB77B81
MRTIEFDEADAPMLMAAMRLAANTALMYGEDQRNAMHRLRFYRDLFQQFAPAEASLFSDEETWTEIAIAMEGAEAFEVSWKPGSWPCYDRGRATVTINDRHWETGYSTAVTREAALGLAKALATMAPVTCELRTNITLEGPA